MIKGTVFVTIIDNKDNGYARAHKHKDCKDYQKIANIDHRFVHTMNMNLAKSMRITICENCKERILAEKRSTKPAKNNPSV